MYASAGAPGTLSVALRARARRGAQGPGAALRHPLRRPETHRWRGRGAPGRTGRRARAPPRRPVEVWGRAGRWSRRGKGKGRAEVLRMHAEACMRRLCRGPASSCLALGAGRWAGVPQAARAIARRRRVPLRLRAGDRGCLRPSLHSGDCVRVGTAECRTPIARLESLARARDVGGTSGDATSPAPRLPGWDLGRAFPHAGFSRHPP